MKNEANVIEVLYTEHCPFWKEVTKIIEKILEEFEIQACVKKVKISSEDEARRLRFPGSPTVRINGVDVDPTFKETRGIISLQNLQLSWQSLRVSSKRHDSKSCEAFDKNLNGLIFGVFPLLRS